MARISLDKAPHPAGQQVAGFPLIITLVVITLVVATLVVAALVVTTLVVVTFIGILLVLSLFAIRHLLSYGKLVKVLSLLENLEVRYGCVYNNAG